MDAEQIIQYCLENFEGVVTVTSWGEKGVYYNPDRLLTKGVYILTVKEKDGANDKASKLDREGIYRLNIGVHKDNFIKMFGHIPSRPQVTLWIWHMILQCRIQYFHIQYMHGWDGFASLTRLKQV